MPRHFEVLIRFTNALPALITLFCFMKNGSDLFLYILVKYYVVFLNKLLCPFCNRMCGNLRLNLPPHQGYGSRQ